MSGEETRVGHFPSPVLVKLLLSCVQEAQSVLELGCGSGDNIGLVIDNFKCDYSAMDVDASAIHDAKRRYPSISTSSLHVADFTKPWDIEGKFDLIFDRASVSHNCRRDIRSCVDSIFNHLVPGGLFIGIDWFSISHSEFRYGRGKMVDDENTFTNYPDGQFKDCGKVHFTSEEEIRDIFAAFAPYCLQERIVRRTYGKGLSFDAGGCAAINISPYFDGCQYQSAVFDLVMRKAQ